MYYHSTKINDHSRLHPFVTQEGRILRLTRLRSNREFHESRLCLSGSALPIKRLSAPRPLFNVDGTTNRKGDLLFYSDLKMKTGPVVKVMRFFLTDLGHHQVILGYPWFAVNQPRIDWAKGWIDASHLPVIISPRDLPTTRFPIKASSTRITTGPTSGRTSPRCSSRLPHQETDPHSSRMEHTVRKSTDATPESSPKKPHNASQNRASGIMPST